MNLKPKRLLAITRRRMRLKNHGATILCNRCVGGVISHNVGEPFRSPLVNMYMPDALFFIFCEHLKEYADCPVEEPTLEEVRKLGTYQFPVGILRGGSKQLPDIPLFFVHFNTFEQAKEKWETRYRRVNYDNVFVIMDCRLYATPALLDAFHALPFENKVVFTHLQDPQRWPNAFRFSFYTKEKFFPGCLYRNTDPQHPNSVGLDEFDYVRWLNDGTICRT